MIELTIPTPEAPPEGSREEEFLPIPSLNVSEPDSIQSGTLVAVYTMRFDISFLFEP